MIEFLNILIPYILGCLASCLITHPVRQWKEGYECAKARYKNWDLGFDEGYKYARKIFQNYDEGFGEGFETGFNVALEYYKQEGEG